MPRGSVAQARRRQERRTAKRLAVAGLQRALHPDPHAAPLQAAAASDGMVTVSFETRIDRALDENSWPSRQERNADLRELGLFVADAARIARKDGTAALALIERKLITAADFAPEALAMEGTCTCSHDAMQHQGPMHDGACSVETCDCTGFEESADDDDAEAASAEAAVTDVLHLQLDGITLADTAVEPGMNPAAVAPGFQWTALLLPEGKLTSDGRCFAPGSVTWRELPLTLGAMLDTPHADMVTKAEACGRIDRIWRDGNLIRAAGVFDTGEYGQKIAQMVTDKTLRGISVDVAVASYEVGPKEDWFDEDGNWRPKQAEEGEEEEAPDLLDLIFGGGIYVVTEGTVGSVTCCPFAAFEDATIQIAGSLVSSGSPAVWTYQAQHDIVVLADDRFRAIRELQELVASAPTKPPSGLFTNPDFDRLTPLTIAEDGIHVFGHAAAWDVCHIGYPDECVTAPHSMTGNSLFHLGQVLCDDGELLSIGKITMATGHAPRNLAWKEAAAHYDNTGTVVADVVSGEDDYGIWVSGALRPNVDEEGLRELRAGTLSGDWRKVNGNLELVACLVVNVPGFPIPRVPLAQVASGEVVALAAAGIHPDLIHGPSPFPTLALEQLRAVRAVAHLGGE